MESPIKELLILFFILSGVFVKLILIENDDETKIGPVITYIQDMILQGLNMDAENKIKANTGKDSRKTVWSCVIAVILIICIQMAGTYLNLDSFLKRETSYPNVERGVQSSLEQLAFSIDDAAASDRRAALSDVYFRALSLRNSGNLKEMLEDSFEDYGKSFVVRVRDGCVIYPDDAESIPELSAEALKGDQGIIEASQESEDRYFTAYSRITDDYYAVSQVYASEGADNLASIALCEIEAAFDGKVLLIDEDGKLIYDNTALDHLDFRGSNGLDEEALAAFLKKHEPYYVTATSADGRYTIVLLLSRASVLSDSLSVDLLVALVEIVLAAMLIVWISEIRKLLKSRAASSEKIRQYQRSALKGKIKTFCVLSVLAVFLVGMFSSAIGSLYSVTWDSQNTLAAVEEMSGNQKFVSDQKTNTFKDKAAEHAKIIADSIYRDPKLRTKDKLSEFREILSANYIMLYDSSGREFLTDSSYINMNIGGLSSSDMHAFRRVLNGGPETYLENTADNVTGAKSDLIGVRLPSIAGEDDGSYDLLVISYPPADKRGGLFFSDSDDLVMSLVSSYNEYMLLDTNKKIKTITITNNDLYGGDPLELGMNETEIRDNFIGEFDLDNVIYYGASRGIDGELLYYMTESSVLRQGMCSFGLIEAVGFLLVLLIILYILMKDYDLIYENSTAEERSVEESAESGSSVWFAGIPWLKNADTPEAKAKATLDILGGICVLVIGLLAFTSARADRKDSLIPYIFSDNWNRGLNLFAAARIIIMVCAVAAIWGALSFIINAVVDMLDTKAATIVRLLKNVLSYAVVLTVLYYSALYLGFDPATLLASLGIIGLAVSLGVKDIIADAFSGISLIFEKAFQVGDIVEIDGVVRGTVQELGVRTIKLLGDDNNLKVVRYSDIHKVNNLSRANSWCIAEFTVKNNVDTEELRKLLSAELPEIRARHKEILSDPVFTGISSINVGSITFGIRAECKESRIRKVRSILNYEIRDLINRNGIDLL